MSSWVAHQLIAESCTLLSSWPRQVCSTELEPSACRDLRDEVRCVGRGLLATRLSGGRLGQRHADRLLAHSSPTSLHRAQKGAAVSDQIDRTHLLN
jgi:hypothetical protein